MHTPTSPVNFACAQAANDGDLLVAHLRELDPVADLVERAEQAVDAVAGIAVDRA